MRRKFRGNVGWFEKIFLPKNKCFSGAFILFTNVLELALHQLSYSVWKATIFVYFNDSIIDITKNSAIHIQTFIGRCHKQYLSYAEIFQTSISSGQRGMERGKSIEIFEALFSPDPSSSSGLEQKLSSISTLVNRLNNLYVPGI